MSYYICSKCKLNKVLCRENFYPNTATKNGFRTECRDCTNAIRRAKCTRKRVAKGGPEVYTPEYHAHLGRLNVAKTNQIRWRKDNVI